MHIDGPRCREDARSPRQHQGRQAARSKRARATVMKRRSLRLKGVKAVNTFKNPALKQLTDQQVRFAPPARRLTQLSQAEKLLSEIDPAKNYPYQFICYRLTDYRPTSYPDLVIDGNALIHDLCL